MSEAHAKGVFNLDQFLIGASYPTESVTVYTDAHTANEIMRAKSELSEIENRMAALKKKKPAQRTIAGDEETETSENLRNEFTAVEDKIAELNQKIKASSLTFSLRGMAPAIVEEITRKHFVDDDKDYRNTLAEQSRDDEIIAKTIVSATNAEGAEDARTFTVDDVKNLRGALLEGEYLKLVNGVAKVNLNGALFDQATDASFLG